jgi:hypothetical protein
MMTAAPAPARAVAATPIARFRGGAGRGRVLDSYAIFATDRDLSGPFSFGWQAGSLSGAVSRIMLAGHSAS